MLFRTNSLLHHDTPGIAAPGIAPPSFSSWLRAQTPTLAPIAEGLPSWSRRQIRRSLASAWHRIRSSPLTLVFAAVNLAIYMAVEARGGSEATDEFFNAAAVYYPSVHAGDWWRLFTSGWAHINWGHVYTNCQYLLAFGLLLEPAMGSRRFALLFGLSTIGSGTANLFLQPGYCAGASGATCGLNGALLAYPVFAARTPSRIVWLWACSLGYQEILRIDEAPIAYAGHMGGFITGLLVASLMRNGAEPRWAPARGCRFAIASFGAVGLALILAFDPRWPLAFKANQADLLDHPGHDREVECLWEEIERGADPERPVEAKMLAQAADFHVARAEYARARRLLCQATPALQEAGAYRDLGALQASQEPRDDAGASLSLGFAHSIDPGSPETMRALAELALEAEDSTVFHVGRALVWAEEAVKLDGGKSPQYLLTLAWAQFALGERGQAVQSLRRALDLGPEDQAEYRSALIQMTRASGTWFTMAIRDRWLADDAGS